MPPTPAVVLDSFAAAKLLLLAEDGLQQHSYPRQIDYLAEKFDGFITSGVPPPTSANNLVMVKGAAPAPSQTPLPVLPSERHAAGVSPSGSSGSFGSASTAVLVLGVLTLFSILLWGGRFSWPPFQLLRPDSALILVAERPG